MHPTVEGLSVGVLGYLRRVMGNVRPRQRFLVFVQSISEFVAEFK
jgi:hypothetical protein